MNRDNPFEFGRELDAAELVDREVELAELVQSVTRGSKLFLIGPRRFGKTSLLASAAEVATRDHRATVLRYNVESFPTLGPLAARIVRDVAAHRSGPVDRVAAQVQRFFKRLKPEISYQPLDHSWTASIGLSPAESPIPLLTEALDGLERAARDHDRPTALILDEFQSAIERGGATAEGEIRAVVQQHRAVGYVFAGSATRMLSEMTTDPARPFYRLGQTRFLGPIPREAFRVHLQRGLKAVMVPTTEGVEAILDEAEDVPYNVQLLAHACWETGRTSRAGVKLTGDLVRRVAVEAARRSDPIFTQIWTGLTVPQRKAALAIVRERGTGLMSSDVSRRYQVPVPTMQKAILALINRQVVREDQAAGGSRLRLEDPLFGTWLRTTIEWP